MLMAETDPTIRPAQTDAANISVHATANNQTQLNQPAQENCLKAGGVARLAQQLNGQAVKMCQLPNGRQCEEALVMRSACI